MTMRVLIVDDEPVARRGIRQQLRGARDVEVVGECGDGASAVAAVAELSPDLVFLDVQMPELDGFDVLAALGVGRLPAVIFVTAYDRHAVRAFDVHAVDYVLKPIDGARFGRALERARERLARSRDGAAARIGAAFQELGRPAPRPWAERLAIRAGARVRLVAVRDVERIESAGNYVEVHAGGRAHLLRETLGSLAARLDPGHFVRVSRSTIVSADRVRELRPLPSGDYVVLLRDGTEVMGSRRYRRGRDVLSGRARP